MLPYRFAFAWCFVVTVFEASLHAADYKTAILDAWTAREREINSAEFDVSIRRLVPKGSYNGRHGHKPGSGDQPAEDTYIEQNTTLYISGKLRRLEYGGDIYNMSEQALLPKEGVLVVQESGEVRELTQREHHKKTPLQGKIKQDAIQLEEATLSPLFYFCRPLSMQLDEYKVVKFLSGSATGVEIKLSNTDGSRSLQIDPNRDYSIVRNVRNTTLRDGSVSRVTLDIEYRRDDKYGWVPSNWVVARHEKNKLKSHCECKLKSYRLNPSLDSNLFTLSFPPGTHVFDMLNPHEQVRYVQQESGDLKEISRQKLSRPIMGDGDLSGRPTGSGFNSWLPLIVNCVLVVALALLLFLKKWKYRHKSAS